MMRFELHPSKYLWPLLGAVLVLCAAGWFALNQWDTSLAGARAYVPTHEAVKAKVGSVSGTTLYKLRYLDSASEPAQCFAEYFFTVSGDGSKRMFVRVRACGSRDSPTFSLDER